MLIRLCSGPPASGPVVSFRWVSLLVGCCLLRVWGFPPPVNVVNRAYQMDRLSMPIWSFYSKTYIVILTCPSDISRICRNLSIHIARFSASESPRAHTNTPKNPHFSLVAGTSQGAMRRGSDSACVSIPHGHSVSAHVATRCVDNSSRFISSLLAFLFAFCAFIFTYSIL